MAGKAVFARQALVGKKLVNRNQMVEEKGRKKLLSLTAPTVTSRILLIDLSLCQHYCVIWQQLLAAWVFWCSKIQRTINCWSLNTGSQDFIYSFLLKTLCEEIKERIVVKGFIAHTMLYFGFGAKQMIRSKDKDKELHWHFLKECLTLGFMTGISAVRLFLASLNTLLSN